MKHRKYYLALAAIVIALVAFLVPPGGPVSATTGPPDYTHSTLSYVRSQYTNFVAGPSKPTGYGKSVITGFPRACSTCNYYNVTKSITNHQPVGVIANGADGAASSGCWPWELAPWSGTGCWNNLSSWNWPFIFDVISGGYQPLDQNSTVQNIVGCIEGAYNGIVIDVGGQLAGMVLENAGLIRITLAGWVYTTIAGCTFYFFHK